MPKMKKCENLETKKNQMAEETIEKYRRLAEHIKSDSQHMREYEMKLYQENKK